MAPSSNQPPLGNNESHGTSLNALLRNNAQGQGRQADEEDDAPNLSVVDILPMSRTKMQRFQDSSEFDEGDYCPIKPEEIKKAKQTRKKVERVRQRQKMVIQKRRVKKKRRVFLKRLKHAANLVSFFMLAIAVWVLIDNPMWAFNGSNFQLKNNHLLTANHLKPILNRYQHQLLYQIDPNAIADSVKKHYPIVDQLYVRRSIFPARMDITVIEKVPFAEIYASPLAQAPVTLAVFEADRQKYQVVPVALYPFKSGQNREIVKLIAPPGYRLEQTDWERLDHLLNQLNHIPSFPLRAVQLVRTPRTEQSRFPLSVVAHYPGLQVFIGTLDAEANQRAARLPLLTGKLLEHKDLIEGVDLRWSEQMTLIKKGAALPLATHLLIDPKKTSDAAAEAKAHDADSTHSETTSASKPNLLDSTEPQQTPPAARTNTLPQASSSASLQSFSTPKQATHSSSDKATPDKTKPLKASTAPPTPSEEDDGSAASLGNVKTPQE